MTNDRGADRLAGILIGTAVGDALGLAREGLSRRRAERLFGAPPLRYRLVPGLGLTSDDTDHACFAAEALLEEPISAGAFGARLATKLRLWLLCLPPGIGLGTLRAILRLWVGIPPGRSGVRSAGNGPAMRSAVVGAFHRDDVDATRRYVRASTELTHADPRALEGALAVALAAGYAADRAAGAVDGREVLALLRGAVEGEELIGALERVEAGLARREAPCEFAGSIGLRRGVSGYVNHTVPAALYCWLSDPSDFRRVVEDAICLGGDSDTVGAIAGALAGATVGATGIPRELCVGLAAWPYTVARMAGLAASLERRRAGGPAEGAPPRPWGGLALRNAITLAAVTCHVLRRLLPPY